MDSHPSENMTTQQFTEWPDISRSKADSLEIITLEEFALRMLVGETTVWKWIRNGHLKPGRHFIQIERVIRFHWCRELIDRLQEDCSSEEGTNNFERNHEEETSKGTRQKRKYGKRINFDI